MNKRLFRKPVWRRAAIIRTCLVALSLGGAAQSQANQTDASFNVAVALKAKHATGGCRAVKGSGTFGATVTVKCGSPASSAGSDLYRLLVHVSSRDLAATVDSYAGVGTSTAFRIVRLDDTDYLEMTVGW